MKSSLAVNYASSAGHSSKGALSKMECLAECFEAVKEEFSASAAMQYVVSGKFTIEHYKEYLRQVYYYTRESPQLIALASVYLRGSDRDMVTSLLKHAREESGHDQWALRDLANLGEDVSKIPYENPLPATLAFNAFTFYQIMYRNPVAHIGYIYFLEFLPTSNGASYIAMLEKLGVPSSAMSFLQEHITIDMHHNKLMEKYAERLIHTEADMEAVQYSMRVTGKLYADLLLAAFEQADNRKNWGICHDEMRRDRNDGKAAASYEYEED